MYQLSQTAPALPPAAHNCNSFGPLCSLSLGWLEFCETTLTEQLATPALELRCSAEPAATAAAGGAAGTGGTAHTRDVGGKHPGITRTDFLIFYERMYAY